MPNIIHYRSKCIGCGICYEMMPDIWRMSRKDGKAVLLNGQKRKETYVLSIPSFLMEDSGKVAEACPARVIKVNEP